MRGLSIADLNRKAAHHGASLKDENTSKSVSLWNEKFATDVIFEMNNDIALLNLSHPNHPKLNITALYVANIVSIDDSRNPPLGRISRLPVVVDSSTNINMCMTRNNMSLDNTTRIKHFSDENKMSNTVTIREKIKSFKFLIMKNYHNSMYHREANVLPFEGLLF